MIFIFIADRMKSVPNLKQEMSLKKTNGVRLKNEENITQG